MQRRAVAVYLVLFVVLASGALGFIQIGASAPEVNIDGPAYTEGDELTVDGRTYTVSAVDAEIEEGEHGAPDTLVRSAEVTWFNDSNVDSAQLENNSTVEYNDGQYRVVIEDESGVSSFTLVEQQDFDTLVENDPVVEATLVGPDGTRYVLFGDGSVLPFSQYRPARTEEFSEGDSFEYAEADDTATVVDVQPSGVTLEWDNPQNESVEVTEGQNFTLGPNEQQYFAHFPDNETVQVLPNDQYYGEYRGDLDDMENFDTRINGLWGIVLLSLIGTILLVTAGYLPNKS